ncbi:MAG: hypothetical protein ABIF77_01405 [bacterium]
MRDHDLTPAEREAFAKLSRERQPSDLLEESTVQILRQRGLLASRPQHGLVLSPAWLATAAAAVLALVFGSFAVGQWTGSRQTSDTILALHEQGNAQAVAQVQQASSEYLTALTNLVRLAATANANERSQVRDAALTSLYSAAGQVVQLAPNDPMAARILQAFERSEIDTTGAAEDHHQVIWF